MMLVIKLHIQLGLLEPTSKLSYYVFCICIWLPIEIRIANQLSWAIIISTIILVSKIFN